MAELDSRFDPRFQRGFDGPRADPVIEPESADDGVPERPRRNPFSVALLVVSIACIVLAFAVIWSTAPQGGLSGAETFDAWKQIVSQLGYSLPLPLLSAGAVGLVLWLVLRAIDTARSSHDD